MSVSAPTPRPRVATLLRVVISLIAILFMTAAPIPIVLTTVAHGDASAGMTAIWIPVFTVGTTLSVIAPLLLGTYASYWSWQSPESRKRWRRMLVVLLALQVVGAILVLVAGVLVRVPAWATIAFVVVSLVLTPAFIRLGRIAQRHDVRPSTNDDWVDTTRADLRKGYRNAGIGFLIGLAAAVVLFVGLGAMLGASGKESSIDGRLVLDGLAFAFIGAAVGMALTTSRISRRIREVLGGEYGSVRKIARVVVRGKSEQLTNEEERDAARYALIVGQWLPFQAVQFVALYAGLLLEQAHGWFDTARPDPLLIGTSAFLVVVLVVILPLQLARARRASAYAVAHALPAAL
jgi:hypothetical protein